MGLLSRFLFLTCAVTLAGLLAFGVSSFAAKGGIPGPPTGGETGNNLSVPAVSTESVNSVIANWATPMEPDLGVHYSYGCDQEEYSGQFKYPNTSCVDNLDLPLVYYDAVECALPGNPCEGLQVERIYWQKVDVNEWSADEDGISPDPAFVSYVDWGDALEAVSWSERSVVRVETQPYSNTIPGFDPVVDYCESAAMAASLDPEIACKVGIQMWHVSGQGITEHWGARATDSDAPISYNYDSPFQIINTGTARLNIAKLVPETATCPEPGGNPNDPPPSGNWTWITEGDGSGYWNGAYEVHDDPYSVEVSVGGKYVFGYNLRMKDITVPLPWQKTGYYRLTFYTSDALSSKVIFDDPDAPNVAPPAVPSVIRALPRNGVFNTILAPPPPVVIIESEDPTADDRLFRPVVDTINNLTYIDICIVPKSQGGGGGGSGGSGGGGGGGNGGSGGGGGRPPGIGGGP